MACFDISSTAGLNSLYCLAALQEEVAECIRFCGLWSDNSDYNPACLQYLHNKDSPVDSWCSLDNAFPLFSCPGHLHGCTKLLFKNPSRLPQTLCQ